MPSDLRATLERDLEGDLDKLSLEDLRTRLRQLVGLIKERNTWEALKHLDAWKRTEFHVSQRASEVLNAQKAELLARSEREIAHVEAMEEQETQRQLAAIDMATAEADRKHLEREEARLKAYFDAKLSAEVDELKIKCVRYCFCFFCWHSPILLVVVFGRPIKKVQMSIHARTHSLTPSLTPSLIHSLARSPTHSLTHSPTHPLLALIAAGCARRRSRSSSRWTHRRVRAPRRARRS